MKQNGNYMRLSYMEHYCRHRKKRVEYYFDPQCRKRDYLYEYQRTGWMPFAIRIIQGRIGKKFVVKHYRRLRLKSGKYRKPRIIMTKVPDMSNIVATADQRECRSLFKEAVAFARTVIADADLKQKWRKRYHIAASRVYSRAMKAYMLYLQQGQRIETELLPQHCQKQVVEQPAPKEIVREVQASEPLPPFIEVQQREVVVMERRRMLRLTG